METNVRKLLRKARNLIRKPENWIREKLALTENNLPIFYTSSLATKFCVMGAIAKTLQDTNVYAWDENNKLVKQILEKNNLRNIQELVDFNNCQATHEDIIQLFDNAIDSCNSKKEI